MFIGLYTILITKYQIYTMTFDISVSITKSMKMIMLLSLNCIIYCYYMFVCSQFVSNIYHNFSAICLLYFDFAKRNLVYSYSYVYLFLVFSFKQYSYPLFIILYLLFTLCICIGVSSFQSVSREKSMKTKTFEKYCTLHLWHINTI